MPRLANRRGFGSGGYRDPKTGLVQLLETDLSCRARRFFQRNVARLVCTLIATLEVFLGRRMIRMPVELFRFPSKT